MTDENFFVVKQYIVCGRLVSMAYKKCRCNAVSDDEKKEKKTEKNLFFPNNQTNKQNE